MSVKDGGLEIRVKADEPILIDGTSNKFQLADYQEGTLKPALDFAKASFNESLQNLSILEANLTEAFASQNKAQQAVERSDIKVTKQMLPSKVPTVIRGNRFNDANAQKEAEENAAEENAAEEKAAREKAAREKATKRGA
ncbi:MAG: hypothetical protein Q9198_005220 [Flavoplaca austrocitrina]